MPFSRAGCIIRVGVRSYFSSYRTLPNGTRLTLSGPLRLRYFFEDVGGVFFKLGQILAMRFDLLPAPYALALFDLFDHATPLPNEVMFQVFRDSYGAEIEHIFSIDPKPLATASFGQVYRGTYHNESVIIKIQKPGVVKTVTTDIALLRGLSWIFSPFGLLRVVPLGEVLDQLEEWLIDELDYRREAANGGIIHAHIERHHLEDNVIVPKIYEEFTRTNVIVESFIAGSTVTDLIRRHGDASFPLDRIAVSTFFICDLMRQYFVDHFFQADPHPGNLMVLPQNTIGFIDFGIVGRPVSATHHFCEFIWGAVNLEYSRMAHGMMEFAKARVREELGEAPDERSRKILDVTLAFIEERLIEECKPIMFEWHAATGDPSLSLAARSSSVAFFKVIRVIEKYGLRLPPDVIAFIRALLIIDMVCLRLTREFNMVSAVHSFFDRYPIHSIEETGKAHQAELTALQNIPVLALDPEREAAAKARRKERSASDRERLKERVSRLD